MPSIFNDNIYDCPFGISNLKEIEKANDRNTMMIENFNKTVKQLGKSMNEKFDELNSKISKIDKKIDYQKDFLEGKIDDINDNLEKRVDKVVENKFKISVYSLIKWAIGIAGTAIITRIAVSLILKA